MASGPFSKQAIYRGFPTLNGNYNGDAVVGGTLTTSPSTGAGSPSQYQQTQPGDRILLSPSDAYAACNNNNGVLYTGAYRYVASLNNSTSVPQQGRAAFWTTVTAANNNTLDNTYQVTSDEAANIGVSLFAGVYINNFAQGNYWWIQESGKASLRFRGNNGNVLYGGANLTGTPTIGQGVYLAAVGNNANNNTGLFDVFTGANSAAIFTANSTTAYNTIDQMITRFVGVAESVPSNGNISIVDLTMQRSLFRQ